ncbi:MAG: hypothetical protein K0S63_70 [Gammaproteobacteria bacterium]|jgi:hypothetical protein|nr:hypothetical protein [Gammaproteobacteria bacterium]
MKIQFFTGMLITTLVLGSTNVLADNAPNQMPNQINTQQQPQAGAIMPMPSDNNQNTATPSQQDNMTANPSMPADGSNAVPASPSQPPQSSQNNY